MSVTIDKETIRNQIIKLLDKAGRDVRLTPRVLRAKAEERLKLSPGGLKDKKELIKKIIMKWWSMQPESQAEEKEKEKLKEREKEKEKAKSDSSTSSEHTLNRLLKFAKAAGKGSSFLIQFKDMGTKEKIKSLRSKLRALGYTFSDTPSSEEIQTVQKETELKKERDSLGPVSTVSTKRKSSSTADDENGVGAGDSSSHGSKKVAVSGSEGNRPVAKRAIQYNSSDEEGDF